MSTSHYPQLGAQRVALALTLGATLCLFAPKTQANMLQGDGEEQAALQSVENRKYIRARTQAEKLLERRPDSFIGTWVLSQVHHYEEGNNPRALFLVRRAKDQLLRNYGARPTNVQAMSWHKKLLREESDLLGEMDRPLEEIAVLDTHDALYKPPLKRARIWPLMKLKRNDEAKEVARELILSNDVRHRVTGFNGLAAVESESYLRVRRWTVLEDGIKRTQGRACILFHNASDSALGVFRFDNAEMLAKRALKAEISDCPKASYSRLIPLYLLQGNFNGAVSAIKKLQRSPVEKRYRQQFHMETKVHLAELLWAVGKFEDGLKLADQVVNAPDRTGMTSETQEIASFGNRVRQSMLLGGLIEQAREKASIRSWASSEMYSLRVHQWEAKQVAMRALPDSDLLVATLRPYLRDVMPWYQGHLIDVVGEGVLSEALEQAAAREQQEPDGPHKAFAMAYFEALRGELAWRKGALKEAIAFAEKALGGLPERAALLRRRVMAWYGDSLLRRGRHDDARTQFQEVLQHYPTTFRHLGLTLPVSFSDDGSPQARALVAVLKNSRRLAPGNLGFQVRAQLSNERLELCLATERGHHFQCVVEPAAKHAKTEALESRLLAMADLFHAKGFAPGIELTQRDINTLDGSPTRGNVDDVLKGILGDPRRDQESAP